MKQAHFEHLYSQEWQEFEELLVRLEGSGGKSPDKKEHSGEIFTFSKRYRRLCHYLSMAKERGYSNYLVSHLNEMVTRGHAILYHHRPTVILKVLRFFLFEYPALIRKEIKWTALACLLFFGPLFLMCSATYVYPDLAYAVFDPETISNYESMYDSMESKLEERGTKGDFAMFGFYIWNNISIGFRTFASGMLFGLGSMFFLVFNGVVLGTVAGHMIDPAYSITFYSFVIGHGSFELTAIALAGAAGLKLGSALIAPGRLKRIEALKQSAGIAMRIVYGVIAMLFVAAFLEAFWSSTAGMPPTVKFTVGGVLWFIVIFYFVFMGRTDGSQSDKIRT